MHIKIAGLILFVISPATVWAGEFDRRSDTHTQLPEQVARDHKNWAVDLDFGTTLDRGNVDQTSGSADLDLFKGFGEFSSYLSGDLQYISFSQKKLKNQGTANARIDYRLSDAWKFFMFNTNAYNEFLLIDYRGTVGAGPWLDFGGESVKCGLSFAMTYEVAEFTGFPIERTTRASFRFIVSAKLSETSNTGFDFFYTPAIADMNNFHLFIAPYIEAKITKDVFGLKLSYRGEYDSRPKPGVKNADSELITSLAIHLGE